MASEQAFLTCMDDLEKFIRANQRDEALVKCQEATKLFLSITSELRFRLRPETQVPNNDQGWMI